MSWKKIKERHDFFSMLIALGALLLSQFPPIYEMFYAPDIIVSEQNTLQITPNFPSGIAVTKQLTISNTGEEVGRIRSAHLFISDEKDNIYYYSKAFSYLSNDQDQFGNAKFSAFSELLLAPNQLWAHQTYYLGLLNEHEVESGKIIREAEDSEKQRWFEKMTEDGWDFSRYERNRPNFEISDELFSTIFKSIKAKLLWMEEGEYFVHEVLTLEDQQLVQSYKISVSDELIEQISNNIQGYKPGIMQPVLFSSYVQLEPADITISKEIQRKIDFAIENNKEYTGML